MAPPSNPTPLAEVEAFVGQDHAEAKELLRSLQSYCFRSLGNLGEETVEDLLGSILLKIWEKRDSYRGNSLKYWVFSIARNHMYDHLRRLRGGRKVFQNPFPRPENSMNLPDEESGEEEAWAASHESLSLQMDMKKALELLPLESYRVVYLCVVLGYTRAEAAELLSIPMGTVTSRLNSALRTLRKGLEGEA